MDENSQTRNNSSPGRTPNTAQEEKQKNGVVIDKFLKKDILFSDTDQGFLIKYRPGVLAEEDVQRLLQTLKEKGVNAPDRMPPAKRNSISLLLEGVHWLEKQPDQKIDCKDLTSKQVYQLILDHLDKTNINDLKTGAMGVEVGPISHSEVQTTTKTVEQPQMELAQKFIYEDASKIPPGVDPKQLDFLRDAASIGAFEWVKKYTAAMIEKYFTSDATHADIGSEYGITEQAVRERINRGMSKMRLILYRDKPELKQEDVYPLKQIIKGKNPIEIFKTEKHKERRSHASKGRDHSKDIKRPGVEKLRPLDTDIFIAEPDSS